MTSVNHTNGHRDPDMFDVKSALGSIPVAVRRHWMAALLTCILTLGLVTLYVYVWPPIYLAEAMIVLERDDDPARDAFYGNWIVFRKEDSRTEINLMTSGTVLKQVIEKENLTYDDVYHPILSQLSYFWQKSWIGKNYKAMKEKLFPDKDAQFIGALSPEEQELGKTIDDMGAGISIQPVGESNVGRVTMKGPSRRVASIANTLLDVYLARRTERYQTEAQRAFDILTEETAQAAKDLEKVEKRSLAFSKENGLVFELQRETLQVQQLTDLEASIAESREQIAMLEASLREIEKQLATEKPTRTISSIKELNALRETTKLKRLEFQTALIQARELYREDSAEIQEIKRTLAELDSMIAGQPEKVEAGKTEGLNARYHKLVSNRDELRSKLEGVRAGLLVREETTAKLNNRLVKVPEMLKTLTGLNRQVALANEKYSALAMKRTQAEVSITTTQAAMQSMRVVGYAVPPASRWWPRLKMLYPAALMVGLLLGVGVALVLSYTSGRIQRADVERGRQAMPLYTTLAVATRGRPLEVVHSGARHAHPQGERSS